MKTLCLKKLGFSAAALLICAALLSGCGRKGDPIPDFSKDEFGFAALASEISLDGAVTFQGRVTGEEQNMEYMVLEIQPVDGELCEGCPFLAQEQYRIDSREAWESENGNSFRFAYRPVYPADIYRWRIRGHNLYSGLPEVTSPIQVTNRGSLFIDAPVFAPDEE